VCFVAVGLMRLPLVAVLLVLGGTGVALSYRKPAR
ncbi:MAG: hypothetical protein RL468_2846, partial [Pseudomonadota bacterium]